MNILIVIPAFNEEKVVSKVLSKIPKKIKNHKVESVVINDGSVDQTEKMVRKSRKMVVSHPINRGLGAALATGFEYARLMGFDLLVTLDGDGQHDPKEIEKLIIPIINNKADFVVGSRVYKKGMPKSRKVLTSVASLVTYLFTGVWTTDSQSGFRAFSKRAIELIDIKVDRMEISSDFFRESKSKKLRIIEVPIRPIYTKYSLRKGQSVWNSFNIVRQLALRRALD